ncbi:hypothetical protein N665_0032s0022 [Sinapis alba]|nr:hypothetical protein N665_0032s0022 [Sinapis alba]
MKAPDSFQSPNRWCDFHDDHGHKTEDCIALKMEDYQQHIRRLGSKRSGRLKHLLLRTDEISFTAKEQNKVLAPHHDSLVKSLTVANCLVKRILVDNGISTNIIFQTAYQDLGLEEDALTRKQTTGEVIVSVYAEEINMSTKFLIVECKSSYNMILGRPWIHDMGAVPSTLHQMVKFPTSLWIKEIKRDQENS